MRYAMGVIILAVMVGIGVTWVCMNSDGRKEQPLTEEDIQEIENHISMCRGVQQSQKGMTLLTRANALAAEKLLANLRDEISNPRSVLFNVHSKKDKGAILIDAIEAGPRRSEIVFVFETPEGRLVHYSHPVDPAKLETKYAHIMRFDSVPISLEAMMGLAKEGDNGILFIEGKDVFKDHPEKIRIPECDAVVALKYADGGYSNFHPLVIQQQ